jgi:hypothetical protein
MIRPWTWTHTSSPCQGFAFEGLGKACWRWKRFFGNQLHCKLLNFFVQVGVGVLGSNFSELYCVCTNASFNGDQLLVWVFAAVCKRIPEVPTFRSVKWTASTQLQACVVHTLFADGGHVVWGQNCPLVVLLSKLLTLRALQTDTSHMSSGSELNSTSSFDPVQGNWKLNQLKLIRSTGPMRPGIIQIFTNLFEPKWPI